MNNVGLTPFFMNDADPTVVTSVRHSLVNGGFDQDGDFLSGFVCSKYSAQANLSSLTRPLAKKGPRS